MARLDGPVVLRALSRAVAASPQTLATCTNSLLATSHILPSPSAVAVKIFVPSCARVMGGAAARATYRGPGQVEHGCGALLLRHGRGPACCADVPHPHLHARQQRRCGAAARPDCPTSRTRGCCPQGSSAAPAAKALTEPAWCFVAIINRFFRHEAARRAVVSPLQAAQPARYRRGTRAAPCRLCSAPCDLLHVQVSGALAGTERPLRAMPQCAEERDCRPVWMSGRTLAAIIGATCVQGGAARRASAKLPFALALLSTTDMQRHLRAADGRLAGAEP